MELVIYELVRTDLIKILPKLLEKIYEQGQRSVIHARYPEQVDLLNQSLWTYSSASFLPHGSVQDGHAEDQPFWLTCTLENPNQATLYLSLDEPRLQVPSPAQKSVFVFETQDLGLKHKALEACQKAQDSGIPWLWWAQNEQGGGWSQKTNPWEGRTPV